MRNSTILVSLALFCSPSLAQTKDEVAGKDEDIFENISKGYDRAKEEGRVETEDSNSSSNESSPSENSSERIETGSGERVEVQETSDMNERERMEVRDAVERYERPGPEDYEVDREDEPLPEKPEDQL